MPTFPEDRRYFEQYKLNRVVTQSHQTPHNQAWWPEGSDPGGANAGDQVPNHVEPSGEGERLSRKRSLSTSSGELRGDDHIYDAEEAAGELEKQGVPLDRKTASHDAQLKRLENAQASKRSRTRLKTMKEQLDETQKQLDENKKALKLAEERARQAEERERQRDAENEYLRQQLENKR
ncbi:hypothetical protein E4U47_000585 [Claviceps purpurea]|nr:hypothetical protein E4U47_000585 [Claviceps purpurea]KAG6283279.1 hypothetical protein E4U48_001101 [Claviceps purpurea]KAG6311269.1 hypothetical protein E4U44_004490 [Claviceps purpurea]